MGKSRKIVWNEGMFLTPHHFQQRDRHQEALLLEAMESVHPFHWGVSELDIDPDHLINGNVALVSLRGIMPDGFLIDIPKRDFAPPIRSVKEIFSANLPHLDVYLALPVEQDDAANCALSETTAVTRYLSEQVQVSDLNTGEQTREVAVARGNFKLLFSNEEMTNYTTLKIAELVRTPAGTIVLKEDYIPPCLLLSASSSLLRFLRGWMEIFSAKANLLAGQRVNEAGGNFIGFSLLQTLNATIPLLSHFIRIGKIHPESCYQALIPCVGALASFSATERIQDVPAYYHTDLQKTFFGLDRFIRAIVEGAAQSRHRVIPMDSIRENIWGGAISDERLFQSQFFLSVAGDMTDQQVMESVPRRIKIGSRNDLEQMMKMSLPGLRVYHTPRPPTSLSVEPGRTYFRMEQMGDYWEAICQSATIGLYVPPEWREWKFEILAVKE
jgi:type VI secretion system protein ImpJ